MAVGVEFDGAEFDGAESDGAEFDGADWTVTNAPSRLSDEEGSSFPGMNSNIMLALTHPHVVVHPQVQGSQ